MSHYLIEKINKHTFFIGNLLFKRLFKLYTREMCLKMYICFFVNKEKSL